jgi:chaperonin GroES
MMNAGPMMNDPMQAQMSGGMQMNGGGPEGAPAMGPPIMDPNSAVGEPQNTDPQENYINEALSQSNIAEKFKKKKKNEVLILDEIGQTVLRGVKADEQSREEWMRKNKEAIELAMLVRKEKNTPWRHASNVKYPLVATAAMQFSARAYPSLVPSDGKIVKANVKQMNAGSALYDAAKRIGEHMSFQLKERIPDWEENMDKLLMTMAITGICFKKTYHDALETTHKSTLVYPENLIINYNAKTLGSAYRVSEILEYNMNEIEEKIRAGEFLDVDLGDPPSPSDPVKPNMMGLQSVGVVDGSATHKFYSVHTYWDLDDDGYEEPYVITIHEISGKVVRIIARWDLDGVKMDGKTIVRIKPIEYFTAFPFVPNPDGSIYAMGFGLLLSPINESVNSLINQLVDAGTMSNLQSGLIAKGLRLKIGETPIAPGEWRVVNSTGGDLREGVFPLPTKEPSAVLFQLMQMLITSGNQLASISEIMVGKMPGQNTPATTTQESVQQGMAVFTAVYKRVYRSLTSEFKNLFRLNKITTGTLEEESKLAGLPLESSDYDVPDWMIVPGADPVGDSQTIRVQKHQFVMQNLMPLGTVNPIVMTERMLKDLEIPDYQEVLMEPQPQEDPKVKQVKAQIELMQQKAKLEQQMAQQKLQHEKEMHQLEMEMEKQKLEFEMQKQDIELQMEERKMQFDMQTAQTQSMFDQRNMAVESQMKEQQAKQQMALSSQMGKQKLQQNEASFKQKQSQQKQKEKTKKS